MAYGIDETFEMTDGERRALADCRIRTTGELLFSCHDEEDVRRLSGRTGIAVDRLERWIQLADLMRLEGIGRQFAELLEATGVRSVLDLRQENPEALTARIQEANRERRFSRTSPGPTIVQDWIRQARNARDFGSV